MPKSRRTFAATAELTTSPPTTLAANERIARVLRPAGNNLYHVQYPPQIGGEDHSNDAQDVAVVDEALVELHPRFRNAIWLKKGSYVVVDTNAMNGRQNKLGGEIVNVVREEKEWRKVAWWPKAFGKKQQKLAERAEGDDESSEEESRIGKMPSSDEDEDE